MEKIKITEIIPNSNNPRIIKEGKFKKLVKSIKEFPEMLKIRPIVVNNDLVVLGGNMRLKACIEAGIKEVYITKVDLSDKKQKEFIIKDNNSFGEWDWDILANEWENEELNEWGIDVWQPEKDVDYSVLDDIDLDQEIESMYQQTKKAIVLEFPVEGFEPVKEIYEKLKSQDIDMPNLFYNAMKNYEL